MAAVFSYPLAAWKRVPFDETVPDYRGDWSSATALMEIRPEPGGDGDPLVSLGASVNGGQGIKITYDAARSFEYAGVTYVGASLIQIIVNETAMEGLVYGSDPAQPVVLHYDLHLTPSGGKKFVALAGTFTIQPGTTR
ncbi:MAG: hypothetical protein VYD00_02170 [Pseudomonadota bacterium]|nr:hypothetical protein [Pseudomonadota bacterium]